MKSIFFKRILAYCLDYFILTFLLSLITFNFSVDTDKYYNDIKGIVDDYSNSKISTEKYNTESMNVVFDYQKSMLPVNSLKVVLMIGYYIVFAYMNRGQTIGKKLFKIRVVSKDGDRVKLSSMIIRSLFIYFMLSSIYVIICTKFFDVKVFNAGYRYIYNFEILFVLISSIGASIRSDNRGLHDLIAKTNVVEEVK